MVDRPAEGHGEVDRIAGEGVCEVDLIHPGAVLRVREALPDEGATRRAAEVFGVLADPTRARIVCALAIEELCVCDVAAVAGLSVSAASHQLKRLRDRGVVGYRKEGRLAFYRLVDDRVRGLMEEGVGHAMAGAASGAAARGA
ncbi:metalloregulator ArsR/SmtB family transcription factor (plasmid) [Rubrobacter marinus]|uniref:Metalloregulator ArsR/SmtB family transcription factor n=1 Tax=Rubrobacter marinus TaxID=2653852 RepID=A0A6G8Q3N7_9ACTN|nr:metalloregulator ArsR/SmtB family transcription factor [Rubrobacter marinus]QIN81082.1 metalloregulator ArsR/SmtB family transcription factor [Rubrobacter marinus]